MNRSTPDDGEAFIQRYLGDDDRSASRSERVASPPQDEPTRSSTLSSRFEERRRWATTTLAALGIATGAGALFAIAAACWATWPLSVKTAFVVVAVLSAYCGGTSAERRDEPLLAHFLYCLGAATFIGGVLALCVGGAFPRRSELWASALPPAALLVFATAQTSRSRSLHFFSAAAFVAAFVALDGGERRICAFRFESWTLGCCALGEYWAWRRSSLSVATVYSGVCVWAFVALLFAPLSLDVRAFVLLGVLGLFQRWFGATFRSAFGATLGVFVALCSLGLAAFPYFWVATFAALDASPFGFVPEAVATLEASFASALFVVFSTRLIFDGARRNVVQFALAIVVFGGWLVAQCVVSTLCFETNRFSPAPPTVAALVFAALLVKIRTERADATPPDDVALDALSDDREFDDLFDLEARAGSRTPRLAPSFESLDVFFENAARRRRFPAYVVSVLAQAVALVEVACDVRPFL
ncbi:MAG: DUF2157 domain-containing protein [Thermoguttaceae bacterium]|nr:DUF2157 domain-containing protein [Thermoguttaceae bacterium]MBQ7112347.1 DUF2157 domain-containing protein [Thermoguttaceae bacterium]